MMESAVIERRERGGAPSLRWVLGLDAATCAVMGALLVAAAAPLAGLFGLPQMLLFWAGVVLFPCAVLMAASAALRPPPPAMVWLVILGNAAWVIASLGVLIVFAPNGLGSAFVTVQALAVVVLLVLERRALGLPS
jgi:hypothetical protein